MSRDPFLVDRKGQWRPLGLLFVEDAFRSQDRTGSPRIIGEKLTNMAQLGELDHKEAAAYSFLAEIRVKEMEAEIDTVILCAERGIG